MKFTNVSELLEYINALDASTISQYDIKFTHCAPEQVPTIPEINSVKITTLSDAPSVPVTMDSKLSENVLYVKEYTGIPHSCSTGKVSLLGREIYTNICEDDSGATVYLNLLVEGVAHHNVPFRLKTTQDNDAGYILLINPEKLSTNED